MTVTEENSTAVKETESASSAEKRTLYVLISELGEYFAHVFFIILKFLGLCGMYVLAMFYKLYTYFKDPLKQLLQKAKDTFVSPFKRHRKARKLGSTEIAKARREKGAWGGFAAWLKVAGRTVFGKRGVLATVVNWGLPVLSCVFLINIVSYANSQTYALKLSVNGDFVCYINDENAFTEAEKIVQSRINYTGSNTEIISFEPTYEVESVGNADLLNQYQIADKMLALLGKEVKEGYGLYLGNSYYGTLSSHGKLDIAMKNLLAQYSTGEEKETVQFDKQISYIQGTYLADSFVNEDDIIKQFTSVKKVASYYTIEDGDYLDLVLEKTGMTIEDLKNLNPEFDDDYKFRGGEKLKISAEEPFLTVMVTREEHYTEPIPYPTEYVNDDMLYAGNRRPQTEGVDGERYVVANVSYINGVEINRRVLSRTTVQQPVTKIIAIGTKPRPANAAEATDFEYGKMLWPVGGYDGGVIGEPVWWHGGYAGHKGIDILAPYGTPVYAAENGVVVAAVFDGGYNGGRGNYVTIQGDSGLTTYYYHNSSVVAYAGQRVIAGDLIAYVGQTGRAYANHLHFGVGIGDTYLNPIDYLPWHQRSAHCLAVEY